MVTAVLVRGLPLFSFECTIGSCSWGTMVLVRVVIYVLFQCVIDYGLWFRGLIFRVPCGIPFGGRTFGFVLCVLPAVQNAWWAATSPTTLHHSIFISKRNAKKKRICVISICMSCFSGTFRSSFELKMDTPIDTVQEAKRNTHTYTFFRGPLTALEGLSSLMTAFCLKSFTDNYGNILALLETVVETPALQTLMQFYNPEMRCFTFQDYQLAPTLEEYSIILNLKIKGEVPFIDVPKEVSFKLIAAALYLSIKEVSDNWKSNGGVSGFSLKFLVRKAEEEFEKKNWNVYNALLAV